MHVRGTVRVGRVTKWLTGRLRPGDIAVIDHNALDGVAAGALIASGVRAVVNAGHSFSEAYANTGPKRLLEAGIALVDRCGPEAMGLEDGCVVQIEGGDLFSKGRLVCRGQLVDGQAVAAHLARARSRESDSLAGFVDNTLLFASKERSLVTSQLKAPPLAVSMRGRHVLVVARGPNHTQDLKVVRSYIRGVRPVLLGVDGGADALRSSGYTPDVVVGDMDSVSDETLMSGAELVVHAYPGGGAPGMRRVRALGQRAKTIAAPGTSEDVAMLLAYEAGATLIVAVGTHSSMEDFLDKGRSGMASTLLTRMKVGRILVDAKGVSLLYRQRVTAASWTGFIAATAAGMAMVWTGAPLSRSLGRLLWLKAQYALGFLGGP